MLQGIYVINLDRRPDRFASLKRQVEASDLRDVPLHRMSAVDSSAKDYTYLLSEAASEEFAALKTTGLRDHHAQLSKGAIGCYLSHYEVWKAVAARTGGRGDDMFLILEDDATVPTRSIKKVYARLGTLQKAGVDLSASTGLPWLVFWELICLAGCTPKNSTTPLEPQAFWSTQAYSLSVGSARKLLALPFFPLDVQIDAKLQEMRDAGALKIYAMPFFENNGLDTDIQVPTIKKAPLRRQVSPRAKAEALLRLGDSNSDEDEDEDNKDEDDEERDENDTHKKQAFAQLYVEHGNGVKCTKKSTLQLFSILILPCMLLLLVFLFFVFAVFISADVRLKKNNIL